MRILILHNSYQFTGGEDRAVAADRALLAAKGHETRLHRRSYEEIADRRGLPRVGAALQVPWSAGSYRAVRELVRTWRPHVAHFHNIFPLISPSAYAACRAEAVPIVQTLHNYRLVCPAGTLLRDGKVCELCVGRAPWPAVRYACYRGSRAQSAVMAATIGGHAFVGTWRDQVDAYIAPTAFTRGVLSRGGLPEERIFVRPNAVDDAGAGEYAGPHSAVFVGRLSPEKGVDVLLDAWQRLPGIPLTVIGGGPLLDHVRARIATPRLRHVTATGELPHAQALARIRGAGMLVAPSICYEGLPFVLLESLSAGVPVIASDLGGPAEVVTHGTSGLLFVPGSARALSAAVCRLVETDGLARALADGARRRFAERYAPAASYSLLMDVYRRVGATA